MNDESKTVYFALDMKKNRIRFTRTTMGLMGNPPYIQILINPSKRMMIIRGLPEKATNAPSEKIHYEGTDERYVELYSTLLMGKFSNAFSQFDKRVTYKVFGEAFMDKQVAIFDLTQFKELESVT